ncbi:hypothetical protein [Streptomyces bugieae]|uniref:Uncharacterized protein n=1 Tax=Streptomyces bugieae TaxID=3098223 RepID=A0ABU7NKZ4_9ACTN|nr:hypothetical protein [Streptomyces sp. DSM 41528]
MAIRKSYVPSEIYGVSRPQYRVDGDGWGRSYSTEEKAKEREAELAEKRNSEKD